MGELSVTILVPSYQGEELIGDALKSVLSQSFGDYNIIVQDDCSKDGTEDAVRSLQDNRIQFFKNSKNLGYPKNLEEARKKVTGDIIYLMAQDDILGCDAILNTYNAFKLSPEIGAVTRPYFWFEGDVSVPIRAKEQLNPNQDEIVYISDPLPRILSVFKTLDQLSGLAFRTCYMDLPFHEDIFPCHVYPFASIFKKHPVVFLKDYNLAVRVGYSQSRHVSSIYNKSPMKSWYELFNNVYFEDEFKEFRQQCISDFVANNYVGLVQIRNFARYRYLWREIFYLLKYRWHNIFNPQFWFFSLGCILMPPSWLIPLVDLYKSKYNSRRLSHIKFRYVL